MTKIANRLAGKLFIILAALSFACVVLATKPNTAKSHATKPHTTKPRASKPPLPQKQYHQFYVHYDQYGLMVNRDDGQFSANLFGYLEADLFQFAHASNMLHGGTNFRYAMLYLNGCFLKNWSYLVSYSLSLSSMWDASITYKGWHNMYIRVGQFLPNSDLTIWSRPLDINMMDWPLPILVFSPAFVQGAQYGIFNKNLSGIASLFSGTTGTTYTRGNPVGATGRLIFSPIHTATRMLHFGVADWWQKPNGTSTVTFGAVPEAVTHNNDMLITTGSIGNVKYYNRWNGEFACGYGPWTFQTEYYSTNVIRKRQQKDLRFYGYYATLGYFITGESRLYAFPDGVFTFPSSIKGKYGAWQVVARYSSLNLTDQNVRGGKEYNEAVGLNWYVNPFVTFKMNVIHAMATPTSTNKKVSAMIYGARVQLQF